MKLYHQTLCWTSSPSLPVVVVLESVVRADNLATNFLDICHWDDRQLCQSIEAEATHFVCDWPLDQLLSRDLAHFVRIIAGHGLFPLLVVAQRLYVRWVQ